MQMLFVGMCVMFVLLMKFIFYFLEKNIAKINKSNTEK